MDEQLIESAREEAATIARERTRLESAGRLVEGVLRDRGPSSLEAVKEPLRRAKSPRMRTCSYYLCDDCNEPILNVDHGFIIHGNVYVADPECRGGLIGNNFPNVRPGEKIEVGDVQENVFCRRCLVKILRLTEPVSAPKAGATPPRPAARKPTPVRSLGVSAPEVSIEDADFMRQLREL